MITQYVLGFAFNANRTKVLLIQKKRPQWQAGLFNGIGGKIESFDISPSHALVREFKEESGVDTNIKQWKQYATVENEVFHVTCFYTVLDNFDNYYSVTDEEIHLIDIKDLYNNQFNQCISNLSWLISMALDKDHCRISSKVVYSKE